MQPIEGNPRKISDLTNDSPHELISSLLSDERTKSLHRAPTSPEELTSQMVAEGGIEGWTIGGRVPLFPKVEESRRNTVICVVPPEGTQHGDYNQRFTTGIYGFFAPNGTRRGIATVLSLTAEQGRELKTRRDAALAQLPPIA